MNQAEPTSRRTWFVFDELASLQRLPQLHTAMTEARKSNSPLVLGFRRGVVSGATLRRAAAAFCFRGRRVEELDDHGRRYARTFDALLRPTALARLEWHRAKGDRIAVVSASLSTYLAPWTSPSSPASG
jgi:phosphoserine phosphatase